MNRLCALFCATLVFMMPVMLAANTQAISAGKAAAQQTQVTEEEEHKTCGPVRALVGAHDAMDSVCSQGWSYAEGAFIAYHGEVAVQPPERL